MCLFVKELGEDGVDLASCQQRAAVTETGQLVVLASGNALGCFTHDPREEPAAVLECHAQARGFDAAGPVEVRAVLQPAAMIS